MIDALEKKSQPITNNSQVSNSPLDIAAIRARCHHCELPVTVVKERTEVSWGGARPDKQAVVVTIDDQYSRCERCDDDYYTPEQAREHSRRVRKAVIEALESALSTAIAERDGTQRQLISDTAKLVMVRDALSTSQERVRELEKELAVRDDEQSDMLVVIDDLGNVVEAAKSILGNWNNETRRIILVDAIASLPVETDTALSPDTQRETT